jgi:galactitol-specific phosphotransferase system IIB component
MKIKAPSLRLDMELQKIVMKDGQPVVISKVGVYEATAVMSKADVLVVMRHLLKPHILLGFLRLTFSRR